MRKKVQLTLVRHGQSIWNHENRFTGWTDVPLTKEGINEAIFAAKLLKESKIDFDVAYTSILKRAVQTYNVVCDELNMHHIPLIKSWRLNERHYGNLTGLNKAETAEKYGKDTVAGWRRSYDIQPPIMDNKDPRAPYNDSKYIYVSKSALPLTESLKNTQERTLPLLYDQIMTDILQEKNVLVIAHANSLRAILKVLDNINDKNIQSLYIPTCIPLVYEFCNNSDIISKKYLGDENELKKKIENLIKLGNKK